MRYFYFEYETDRSKGYQYCECKKKDLGLMRASAGKYANYEYVLITSIDELTEDDYLACLESENGEQR